MPITVNDSFDINAPKPGDLRYLAADLTPWASPAAAKSIPAGKRHKGLTVLIEENGDLSEWWWDVDTSDNGLHRKAVPAGYRSTKQIHVAIRTDGKAGTGSYLDPYDWSDPAVSLVHLQAWSAARVPMTIHMAEGRYVIHPAYHNARPGQTLWMLWSGLSIKGAGKDRTFIVPAENGPGGWSMLGTNYTGNQPPGSANATERITRISLTDFTIDGEMDYAQEYGDRTWAGLSMDGDNIDIRRVRITRLGGGAQELFPIIIYHTPTYDEMSRECGIFIDECEVVNVPYSMYTGCTGLIIAGGNTPSTADGHQIRNKYVVVSRCRLENAGSLGVSQMRNVYFNDCHVDPKGKLICMNIDTGPVYNIRFTNCTFIMGQDQFRHSGAANVGGGASIYEVSFNGCYFHSAINGYTQASVKLQGNAKVSLTDCTHEPATIENKQWAEDANGNPIYGQDAATYNGWYGAIVYHIDGSVQGGGWHIKNGEEGNLLHCSGNRMFNGSALPAILCDTPPQSQNLVTWDKGGFMLNQTHIQPFADSNGWPTSDYLFFEEHTLYGSANTIYIGLPNLSNARQGMRRVITMVQGSSCQNLQVMLTATQTVVDQSPMPPGARLEYVFLDGAWKRQTDNLRLQAIGQAAMSKVGLEAITGSYHGASVVVQNLYPNSPHSGGIFVLDINSTATVNGGTVISSAAGGRWIRQYSGPIDIRWFGAMPGVVADQSPAINAALRAWTYDSGTEIFAPNSIRIPRGRWWIHQPIRLYRGNIVEGEGDNDQDGSTLVMMDNSNCSAIQTPFVHNSDPGDATQYLRVRNLRIDGRWEHQTIEATAVDWRGVYASSELSYIWVQTWLGPAYKTGANADTSLNQLYALYIATQSYACQFSDEKQVTGQGGFMLIKDIYCEQVIEADQVPSVWTNPIRGNAFLFNRLVSVNARGLHTEYVSCPITIRNCQTVSIDGASGYGDGWHYQDGVNDQLCPEGALIVVDGTESFYHLHIGPYSAAIKAPGVQVFKSFDSIGYGVFPNTEGTEGGGLTWGGIDTTNNLVSQGVGGLSYGQITSGYNVTAGNPQSVHPRLVLTKTPYSHGNPPPHDFYTEYRTDPGWNICFVGSNVDAGDGNGVIGRTHFAYGLYGTQGGFRLYDPLVFMTEMPMGFNYMMGRTGEDLYFRNAAGTRKFLMQGDVAGGGTLAISGGGTGATTADAARLNLDVGLALPLRVEYYVTSLLLDATNTRSTCVIEGQSDNNGNIAITNLDGIKRGDIWEICQVLPFVLTVMEETDVGQAVTLRFPPGGGPNTAGQWSVITIWCRDKIGSGPAATAELVVTGGVP